MDLLSFYNANKFEDTATYNVVISDRITDENGDPFSFTVKPLSTKRYKELERKATKTIQFGNKLKEQLDEHKFSCLVIAENTVTPNFKDAESLEKLGLNTPIEAVEQTLNIGEVAKLSFEIARISGMLDTVTDYVGEVKN